MPSADDFRAELRAQIDRARRQGRPHVEINAGELHRIVGSYPGDHRMPVCCEVLRSEQKEGDELVYSPADGNGASLTIRYKLPREVSR